jgi:5-methyltetrahydropteroyltriglutamate--homocysteine methyltransferase
VKLPAGATLVPGVAGHCSDSIEHPDLVAERIVRLARVVGRERVIAGTDCGFASTLVPGQRGEVDAEIVWAKFRSLTEGAKLASKALWA